MCKFFECFSFFFNLYHFKIQLFKYLIYLLINSNYLQLIIFNIFFYQIKFYLFYFIHRKKKSSSKFQPIILWNYRFGRAIEAKHTKWWKVPPDPSIKSHSIFVLATIPVISKLRFFFNNKDRGLGVLYRKCHWIFI